MNNYGIVRFGLDFTQPVRRQQAKRAMPVRHDRKLPLPDIARKPPDNRQPLCNGCGERPLLSRVTKGCTGNRCLELRAIHAANMRDRRAAEAAAQGRKLRHKRRVLPVCDACGRGIARQTPTAHCKGAVCTAERTTKRNGKRDIRGWSDVRRHITELPVCKKCRKPIMRRHPTSGCAGLICKAERAAKNKQARELRAKRNKGA